MIWRALATFVVLVHFGFVIFVVTGGLFVMRWPWLKWIHLPCAVWGALIEFGGWICPLTPLENWLRQRAGQEGYAGGFLDHYLFSLLYPEGLTRPWQIAIGVFVVVVNSAAYWYTRRTT